MEKRIPQKRGLAFKLMIPMGMVLFFSIFVWSQVTINIQEKSLIEKAVSDVDKFCNTVLNFTWFAMLHNPNKDMLDVLKSMSEYNKLEKVRLYDGQGKIKFSNNSEEINTSAEKKDVACKTCHSGKDPVLKTDIKERIRIFESPEGELLLGIINPILNEPGCSTAECHYHPKEIKKIGTLDVIVSLKNVKTTIGFIKKVSAWTAVYLFVVLCLTVWFCISRLVTNPINRLIQRTDLIGKGIYQDNFPTLAQRDEIGKLALAIKDMGEKIKNKQDELNKQRDRYQNLFDQVPCSITVQSKDFKLIEFNKEFSKKFNPEYGDHCFFAYKNLSQKCTNCPVERTFTDGQSHFSEESGINKDGTVTHWFVKTAPLKDESGNIVAAMEMSIDISRRKRLEGIVKDSERKYQAVFRSIPNPIFILDIDSYIILNCNDSALNLYGYSKEEIESKTFSLLFPDTAKFESFTAHIKEPFHERLMHRKKTGETLYVNIWVSPADFTEQTVLLVTVIDITLSIETEQQLIQAGKMATLGEMATGVAHELNQPLSVIKTASSFISRKLNKNESIEKDILNTLAQEIESHVDRASKITNHMRLFGRKSTFSKEPVNLNDVIKRSFEIFSQQLKLREIEVIWELDEALPLIPADPVRLEQVFINLLINARDSIVTRTENKDADLTRRITIATSFNPDSVTANISDTGTGIPAEVMDKIFEPFFTTKKVGEGTGLGLSISYGIIREFGGNISVKNNPVPPGGAVFSLRFKRDKEGMK
ncbi:MAG: ATP-binding protein [Desulfobacula sp.]|jgi:histidine kinase